MRDQTRRVFMRLGLRLRGVDRNPGDRRTGLFLGARADFNRSPKATVPGGLKPLPVDEQKPLLGGGDANDLILWLAYKEAKAMIQFDAAPAAPKTPNGK
jgi:hypothetical protein